MMRSGGPPQAPPQTGHGAVPRWARSCAAMRSCSASGAVGGIAGAAHLAPRGAVELVLAAVGAVGRHRGGSPPDSHWAMRCSVASAPAAGAAALSSASCALGAAAVTPSAASVCGPATPSARQAVGALEALDGGPRLRAVDAVGADAELLLQGAHGVGALHAGRERGRGVLGERAGGGDGEHRDGQRHPRAAAQSDAPAARALDAAGLRGPQRAPPRDGRTEIAIDCHVDFEPSGRLIAYGVS